MVALLLVSWAVDTWFSSRRCDVGWLGHESVVDHVSG